jgi:hypothetical protein
VALQPTRSLGWRRRGPRPHRTQPPSLAHNRAAELER